MDKLEVAQEQNFNLNRWPGWSYHDEFDSQERWLVVLRIITP